MRLFVTIKLRFVLAASALLLTMASLGFGQVCQSEAGTVTCTDNQECSCETRDGKFYGRCFNVEADSSDAEIVSKAMGTTVTDEELKNDPQLQEGLRKGKITTKDGAVITLKPIDQIRARFRPLPGLLNRPISIDRTQLESRFDEVIRTESVDRAIEGYQTLLNNSLVTINGKPTLRLESLGEEALKKKLYDAAIRFFQLNVETYPELGRAYFKLADAYESRFKLGAKTEDRENAIRNYELVLTSKITNPIVRDRALERLKSLRGQ